MTAQLIDGRLLAEQTKAEVRRAIAAAVAHGGERPGLAVVKVGDDPASAVYVCGKRRACEEVGIVSFAYDLPAQAPEGELLDLIDELNGDPRVHGILVQLPLPGHIARPAVIERIDPRKDVDGFHPENIGRLALRQRGLRPCTSKGVMTMLTYTDRPVRGQNAIVVGVSNHVGRPMTFELMLAGCTTTACHKFTRELPRVIGQGDIVIVAVGQPGLIKGEWIKSGAVVIDVGINRMPDGRLVGDVQFDAAAERASWITPVPGGVGPMTVATLMQNTVEAAEQA